MAIMQKIHQNFDDNALYYYSRLLSLIIQNDLETIQSENLIEEINTIVTREKEEKNLSYSEDYVSSNLLNGLIQYASVTDERYITNESLYYVLENLDLDRGLQEDILWRMQITSLMHNNGGNNKESIRQFINNLIETKDSLLDYQLAQVLNLAFSIGDFHLIECLYQKFSSAQQEEQE